jgi:hypothetical protein
MRERRRRDRPQPPRDWNVVYRIVTDAGVPIWVREFGGGVFDAEDKLAFLEGFVIDITELKRLEEINERTLGELAMVCRPLAFFAGIWIPQWKSVRKLKEGETTNDLYAFLTTEPSSEVGAIHPKAMLPGHTRRSAASSPTRINRQSQRNDYWHYPWRCVPRHMPQSRRAAARTR